MAEGNIEAMNTISIKLPAELDAAIASASAEEHISKSALVRRALEAYLVQRRSAAKKVKLPR